MVLAQSVLGSYRMVDRRGDVPGRVLGAPYSSTDISPVLQRRDGLRIWRVLQQRLLGE
jgi:hypothetical protein